MARIFARFPTQELREKLSVDVHRGSSSSIYFSLAIPEISILEVNDEGRAILEREAVTVYENITFDKFSQDPGAELSLSASISDILERINALKAWEKSTGKNVSIVVIDTGIKGNRPDFYERQHALDLRTRYHHHHWADDHGHGTMCAAIAAAKKGNGARYSGVAPDSKLIAARTKYDADDIFQIFDRLHSAKVRGEISGPLVVNGSFGKGSSSEEPEDHPYIEVIRVAISIGIVVVFAAGNNHKKDYDAKASQPDTIWAANSIDEAICVGAVDWNGCNTDVKTPHSQSSRGPGQWARQLSKPDCVAPCYGDVLWGSDYFFLPWWGTSGCAPQVAGLAALLLSVNPNLTPDQIGDLIRGTCEGLPWHKNCVGAGMIDCYEAVAALS
jgi:serine protease AprX